MVNNEGPYSDNVGFEDLSGFYGIPIPVYVVAVSCPCGPMVERGGWFECDTCGDRVRVQDVWDSHGLGQYMHL